MKVSFLQSPYSKILKDVETASILEIYTASLHLSVLDEILIRLPHKAIATIFLGMFARELAEDVNREFNIKVRVCESLHTKLILIKHSRKWIIYVGSANLTVSAMYGINFELTVRIESDEIPKSITQFMKFIFENSFEYNPRTFIRQRDDVIKDALNKLTPRKR